MLDRIPLHCAVGDQTTIPDALAKRLNVISANVRRKDVFDSVARVHPDCIKLVYLIAGFTIWDSGVCNDPIGAPRVRENPDWLLLDNDGKLIRADCNASEVATDPGAPGYAEAWADEAVKLIQSVGAQGVFVDNGCRWSYAWNFDTVPARYPKFAAGFSPLYALAMDRFMAVVSARFHAEGLLVVTNCSGEDWRPGSGIAAWDVDGHCTENGSWWEDQFTNLRAGITAQPDKLYLHFAPQRTASDREWRYRIASFLILRGAKSFLAYGTSTLHPPDDRNKFLDMPMGEPFGPAFKTGKLYTRPFEGGTAWLNTSSTDGTMIVVPLGMRDRRGAKAKAGPRTLAKHDGLVLKRG